MKTLFKAAACATAMLVAGGCTKVKSEVKSEEASNGLPSCTDAAPTALYILANRNLNSVTVFRDLYLQVVKFQNVKTEKSNSERTVCSFTIFQDWNGAPEKARKYRDEITFFVEAHLPPPFYKVMYDVTKPFDKYVVTLAPLPSIYTEAGNRELLEKTERR